VKKIYLIGLKLFDSKDAEFPLQYEQVTNVKKQIFHEFLRFDADEHVAIDLFGDLALPDQILQFLSIAPRDLKISQNDGILIGLKLPNVELVDERLETEISSNPVLTERPVFLLIEDDKQRIVESSAKGVVPKLLEDDENLEDGTVGYVAGFVTNSEAERVRLFDKKVAFVCRDPKDSFEKRMGEKLSKQAICSLIHLIDFCEVDRFL